MTDKFQRHKSTRWVKASVPTYGDDWGDEYDSDTSQADGQPSQTFTSSGAPPLPDLPAIDPTNQTVHRPSDLVLSIDHLASHDDDLSDDELPKKGGFEELVPPTPTFSEHNVETPTSDRSFQSDADSIQHETDLNVRGGVNLLDKIEEANPDTKEDEHFSFDTLDQQAFQGDPENREDDLCSVTVSSDENKPEVPPLVLSVDGKKYENDDDDDDDNWGYNSDNSSKNEYNDRELAAPDTAAKEVDTSDSTPEQASRAIGLGVTEDRSNEHSRISTEALDNLINDLEKASVGPDEESFNTHQELVLDVDFNDVSLPDFDRSFDYDTTQPPTPVEPLSYAKAKEEHENYVNDLLTHKPSVRKPPRQNLQLGDYLNIADAVNDYIEEEKPVELHPVVSSGSLSTGKFSVATDKEKSDTASSNVQDTVILRDEFAPPGGAGGADDLLRRVSTMTTGTFNMGSWAPNTGNYRDQFISNNDNESAINFNPSASDNAYDKFTSNRNGLGFLFDAELNTSSLSVPETIDIGLPSIHEDETDDNYDLEEVQPTTTNMTESTNVTSGTDSVLADHVPQPVFREEKLTPLSSKEALVVPKRSMLDVIDDVASTTETDKSTLAPTITEESKRVASTASDATTLSFVSKPPTARPTYDWTKIMAVSQPVDRIRLLREALVQESTYETGLNNWLQETLKTADKASSMHVGLIASKAYENATHNDIRRHASIRSKVSSVRDKVGDTGLTASNFGKRFLSKGRKFMKSAD